MRTHGWGGRPPGSDAEARARILSATRLLLRETGTTRTSEVAGALGVTRQTVYRYYPTTEGLLDAAALQAVAELETDLIDHVASHLARTNGDAGDAVVEIVAYVYEHLRDDPALNRLVAPGHIHRTLAGLTTPTAIALGGEWLGRIPVDWQRAGLDPTSQVELVEHLLRTLQSLVLDPGEPHRTGPLLRAYLQRWLAPALRPA